AVRAARESAEHLGFALEAADIGTWEWDLRTGQMRWSELLERSHGLEPGSFGGTFADFARDIHPDDRERVLGALRRSLEDGVPYSVEYRVYGPDGAVQWFESHGRVKYDQAGRPAQVTGVCRNITARKRGEEA